MQKLNERGSFIMFLYTCEDAWNDIYDYYHKRLNSRHQELRALARAFLHIYSDSKPEDMNIECERCWQFLRRVEDGCLIHF